ncbi:hypothetical protein FBQ97_00785 [Acidobacteria bacterium ACD]|nr:MAG: hypothetical protein EDX89_14410 [Acidobacteriota bacterium]MCE7957626.1 hypothetical protein [Acidobacteria bacterium ACB2]MDL1948338.1 hypothetical protein [Acidobacteria bacterium ACD]
MRRYFVGLDLGQAQNYTALVVLERDAPGPLATYALRHAERVRGISYLDIVEHVRGLLLRPPLAGSSVLAVDATGVGAAVTDLFRRADLGSELVPVTIHGGDRVTRDGDLYRVPKRNLAAVVAVLLQGGRLRIASSLPLAPVLTEELRSFRVTINPATAHESYAAWREADHDDLVLAVALAAWTAEAPRPGAGWLELAGEIRSRR